MTHMAEYRNLTRNILKLYRTATEDEIVAGQTWYDATFTLCEKLAAYSGHTLTQAAVAFAHLSPRITYKQNVEYLELLLQGEPQPVGALTRSWERAAWSLEVADPLSTFSRVALKTGSFARAILGDPNAVVVDVWSARAAGVGESMIRSSSGYHAVAEAYRRGARRVDQRPRDLQAITWVVARGSAR